MAVVKDNQSMSDVVLQTCGSMEAAAAFCLANNVALSDKPVPGTTLTDVAVVDKGVLYYLATKSVTIGTLANDYVAPAHGLGLQIVLLPAKVGVEVGGTGMGYYNVRLAADPSAFIGIGNLQSAWLTSPANVLKYQTLGSYVATPLGAAVFPSSTTTMQDAFEKYSVPYTTDTELSMMLWDANPTPVKTFTYKDIAGNEVLWRPVVFLKNDSNVVLATLCPTLLVELVSSDESAATIRLTRSVPEIGDAPDGVTLSAMDWVYSGDAGTVDPLDSGNADKLILERGAGLYTLGVIAHFERSGVSLPVAQFSCVIEIL